MWGETAKTRVCATLGVQTLAAILKFGHFGFMSVVPFIIFDAPSPENPGFRPIIDISAHVLCVYVVNYAKMAAIFKKYGGHFEFRVARVIFGKSNPQ